MKDQRVYLNHRWILLYCFEWEHVRGKKVGKKKEERFLGGNNLGKRLKKEGGRCWDGKGRQ